VDKYLASTTRLHHPDYLAHQLAVPHYAGALAAFVEGFTNNVSTIYEMGPGAVSIEYFMINWLLEKVGWQPAPARGRDVAEQPCSGGVLTHGGSLANFTALVAARSRIAPQVWQDGILGFWRYWRLKSATTPLPGGGSSGHRTERDLSFGG